MSQVQRHQANVNLDTGRW